MTKWLVTGGAGFIGCNVARRLMQLSHEVVIVDDLSRRGTQENLEWLRAQGKVTFVKQDIRDAAGTRDAVAEHDDADVVLHLAGQVAVTTSVTDPRSDFEINALGTFNVLEAVRASTRRPIVLYASTNKVYGNMEHEGVALRGKRYGYKRLKRGVNETTPLDFHSPYGCSKGAADQYVRDYCRIYGLQTVVFRQSCIYGTRQFGIEDQGWVAWFSIAAVLRRKLTIFGNGRQVRDVLFVDDLAECYLKAVERIERAAGQVYNIGGGPENQLSLLQLLDLLRRKTGRKIKPAFADWRPGDQKVFVSDVTKAKKELGWVPRVSAAAGVDHLIDWVTAERAMLERVLG
jgi:CDP-paratose 2-epimerase